MILERSRTTRLAWALVCVAVVALLAVGVDRQWDWIVDVDAHAQSMASWAEQHSLDRVLLLVETAFATLGITIYSLLLAGAMLARGHRRAAVFVVIVMVTETVLFTQFKARFHRARPPWQYVDRQLDSYSFPSGHATSIAALGGVVVVLTLMLVRRKAVRRLVAVLAVLLAVLIDLDRVLLGRHYPSDVLAGNALGAATVLVVLLVYNPMPRSHAEKIPPLPEPFASERRLAVVVNPSKVEDVAAFQQIVSSMALASGWSTPSWHFTTPTDSGTGQAEQASVEGADLVIVCGGDGTVREVCAELAGTGIPVGIVPAGTGNLLARNLDIPLYIRAAIDVALTGQDRAIDMVKVHGDGADGGLASHFLVMAGMGFDAAIMEGVNEDIKKRVGWLAYVWAALKSLMFPATPVEIAVDGGDYTRHRARTIVVGNVGFLQAGLPLLPDAAIDDGRLDVVLLYPRWILSWIPLAFRVLARRPHTDELVNRMTGRTVSIRAAVDLPRQLDGDSVGPGRELHMECVHGRLLVRVPR